MFRVCSTAVSKVRLSLTAWNGFVPLSSCFLSLAGKCSSTVAPHFSPPPPTPLSLSLAPLPSRSHTLFLSLTHTLSHSLSLSLTLSHSLSHSIFLSHTLAHSLSRSLSLSTVSRVQGSAPRLRHRLLEDAGPSQVLLRTRQSRPNSHLCLNKSPYNVVSCSQFARKRIPTTGGPRPSAGPLPLS